MKIGRVLKKHANDRENYHQIGINPSISPHGVLLWHEGSASTAIRRSV